MLNLDQYTSNKAGLSMGFIFLLALALSIATIIPRSREWFWRNRISPNVVGMLSAGTIAAFYGLAMLAGARSVLTPLLMMLWVWIGYNAYKRYKIEG